MAKLNGNVGWYMLILTLIMWGSSKLIRAGTLKGDIVNNTTNIGKNSLGLEKLENKVNKAILWSSKSLVRIETKLGIKSDDD